MQDQIAIIGMSCRFPGANNPDAFWDLLINGRSPLREIPADRWDIDQYYSANESAPGKMYVRHGYFLDDIDQFDPQFFRISPKEALSMDPQQRLLLEVSWEAFTSAGIDTAGLMNSNTGVFVGLMNHDYWQLINRHLRPEEISFIAGMGNSSHCAAGRIAYTFGLRGPCATIDTACSSSLVALYQACRALQQGDCAIAIAGAANVILDPHLMMSMCNGKVLARDGRCKSFDANADGYGRGEGCGVVILKRLSDALNNNDPVLAVIRGMTVNQNGSGNGLTVPNGEAQRALLQKAFQAAKIATHEVDYLEAHASATQLGDLIEMNSIAAVMGNDRERDRPLYISSVKPYIGHLESASGMAGLIKVILSLQHQQLPPHLHLTRLNPDFDLASFQAVIPDQTIAWRRGDKARIAGVSSFGISGTNAHVIISESDRPPVTRFTVNNPFQRKRYWLDINKKIKQIASPSIHMRDVEYNRTLKLSEHYYLSDHRVFDSIMFPAAGFIETALAVGTMLAQQSSSDENAVILENVQIEKPLVLTRDENIALQVKLKQTGERHSQTFNMEINGEIVASHVRLTLDLSKPGNSAAQNLRLIEERCKDNVAISHMYSQLEKLGLQYGPLMRPIQHVRRSGSEALAKLTLPPSLTGSGYTCHPVLLDGAFQALAMNVFLNQFTQGEPEFYLPLGIKKIVYHGNIPDEVYVHLNFPDTDISLELIEADLSVYDKTGRLLLEINGFYLKRTDGEAFQSALSGAQDKYLYQQAWRQLPLSAHRPDASKELLIIGNNETMAERLERELQAGGMNTRLLPSVAELETKAITPDGIVYLDALNAQDAEMACAAFLEFLQALQRLKAIPDVYILTQGARRINPTKQINLSQAPLWGMLQCARHELTEANLYSIDLDPDVTDINAVAKATAAEIIHADNEFQVAIRQRQRYGLRLERYSAGALLNREQASSFTGTYLVTGGLGGLGFTVVEWLVHQGVRHIALVSRRKPDHDTAGRLEKLRFQGVHIEAFQADAANRQQVQEVLMEIRRRDSGFAPLRGVIHSAGVLSDAMISNQNREKYQEVFRPKIAGAWNLHELTMDDRLEHFILFSSIASVIGAPGQTNYGAANAFLDALAQHRHLQGLPALSLNWGPWSDVGMASALTNALAERGVHSFAPEQGIALLSHAARSGTVAQLVAADIDWQRFIRRTSFNTGMLFSELIEAPPPANTTITSGQKHQDLPGLLMTALKTTLGFDAEDNLGHDDNFFDLGMDSLLAMQFNETLKNMLGEKFDLPMVVIFQHPTLNSLVSHVETLFI